MQTDLVFARHALSERAAVRFGVAADGIRYYLRVLRHWCYAMSRITYG